MNAFVKWMDNLGLVWKLILALPVLDIVWVIYRLMRSIDKGSVLSIVLAILLIVIGLPFLWLIDMITILLTRHVIWLD